MITGPPSDVLVESGVLVDCAGGLETTFPPFVAEYFNQI
jgi:hypothetical protein